VDADDFGNRPVKEPASGRIDTRNVAIHGPRVDHVCCLLDDLTIMFLHTVTFGEPGNFNQKRFMSKRHIKIVVGASGQAFHAVVGRLPASAHEQDRNTCGSNVCLNSPAKLDAIKHGHYHVANHQIRLP